MIGAALLLAFDDRNEAYFAYAENARKHHEPVHSLDWFDEYWRGLKGLPRQTEAEMREELVEKNIVPADYFDRIKSSAKADNGKEDDMASTLESPFRTDDVKASYKLWCEMPHAKRKDFIKPGIKKFREEIYPKGRAAYLAKQQETSRPARRSTTTRTSAPAAAPEGMNADLLTQFQQFQAFLAMQQGAAPAIQAEVEPEPEEEPEGGYETRTKREDVPADAARNALLWAINSEGLIAEALDTALGADGALLDWLEENGYELDTYLTQEVGTQVMEYHFGPLPTR